MKIVLTRLVTLLITLHMFSPAVLAEQHSAATLDVESPGIQFDQGDMEIVEGVKLFTAVVTDNIAVAMVTLYYKNAGDVSFKAKEMKKDNSQTDVYSVELWVDPVIATSLELYIKAEDVSGNSVFEGQKFSPLTYKVVPRKDSAPAQKKVAELNKDEEKEGMSTWKKVLIGVGTVALIGIATGGGGGGDVSGGDTTGSITITTPIPD